jgi:hypothetical protein
MNQKYLDTYLDAKNAMESHYLKEKKLSETDIEKYDKIINEHDKLADRERQLNAL